MQVLYRCSDRLPKLAWCAVVDQRRERVVVNHGRAVEIGDGFFIEGTWNGDFAAGDFASTECVFGSGGVITRGGVTFVPSCSTTDSLFYAKSNGSVTVSNSLPLLLAATGDQLNYSYTAYFNDCESILKGINNYRKRLQTRNGFVTRLLFRNLVVTRDAVRQLDKQAAPRFGAYEDYYAYLDGNYRRIVANLRSPLRAERVDILSTQSRGYDTTAVNAIASQYGVTRVFTSPNSKSIDPFREQFNTGFQNDDGTDICRTLGLECVPIDRRYYERSGFPEEYLYYAGQAGNQDANLLEINTHVTGVSVLLTGVLGEMWYDAAGYEQRRDYITSELRRSDVGGHGLTEVRLRVGFVQVALPFIGGQRREDIYRITNSPAMRPWHVSPAYNRPIARRIAEERGIPRQFFGQTKMGSVVVFPGPRLPYNPELRQEFLAALVERGVIAPWQTKAWPAVHALNRMLDAHSDTRFRAVYYLERAVSKITNRPFEFGRMWPHLKGSLFCHCVNKCVREYAAWMQADAGEDRRAALSAPAREVERVAAR